MHWLVRAVVFICSVQLLLACACQCGRTRNLLQTESSTPHTIAEAGGDANKVGQLLFSYQAAGASAQNLSDTVSSANLPPETQRNAFAEAIKAWLLGSGNQAGKTISAALLSNQTAAVSQAYAEATTAPLQFLCRSLISAQNVSAAAGQAARSGFANISSAFGPEPCRLFQGTAGQKYVHDSHVSYTGPSLDCEFLQGNVATKQDCSTAIRQLQDKNSTSCVVTNNATTQNPGQYSAVLAQFGTCQVTLGAMYNKEASLPCYALASYATNVTSACQDLQGATGGTLFPTGIPRNASVGNGIFLTVDYPRS